MVAEFSLVKLKDRPLVTLELSPGSHKFLESPFALDTYVSFAHVTHL